MVQIPNGTGKTHLLASVIYDHLEEKQGQCLWIVAHRRELVERLIDGLEKQGADGDFQGKGMDTMLNRRPTIERLYMSGRKTLDGQILREALEKEKVKL